MKTVKLFVIIVILAGCAYTQDQAGYANMNFIFSDKIQNENLKIEIFHGDVDTIKINEREFFNVDFKGSKGGSKYFLGYKYSQFDPLTVKRLKILNNGNVIYNFRLDQLDSLPYEMIDTFKVHILPIE